MPAARKNPAYLNGIPELLILRLLAEKPMYGYEIVAAIQSASRDALAFGEGIVYPVLHALEGDGLLDTRRVVTNGRPRVYYRLTRSGRRRLQDSTEEWNRVVDAVRLVLGGPAIEPAAPR